MDRLKNKSRDGTDSHERQGLEKEQLPGNPSSTPSASLNSSEGPGKSRSDIVFFSMETLKNQLYKERLSFEPCVGLGWAGRADGRPIFQVGGEDRDKSTDVKRTSPFRKGRLNNERSKGETGYKQEGQGGLGSSVG